MYERIVQINCRAISPLIVFTTAGKTSVLPLKTVALTPRCRSFQQHLSYLITKYPRCPLDSFQLQLPCVIPSQICHFHTDKKENKIFPIYKENQMGSGAKSFMRKGFLIYEEMRKFFTIYEEAVSHIWLCTLSLWISLYMRNFFFFFISTASIHTSGLSLYEYLSITASVYQPKPSSVSL
jgi:hypothetical protein